MFYNRVKELCKQKGMTIKALTQTLGLSSNSGTRWKSGQIPKADTAQRIADYFGVSTDYLLTESDDVKNRPLTENEVTLLRLFEQLDIPQQYKFIGRLEDCVSKESLQMLEQLRNSEITAQELHEMISAYHSQKSNT